MAARGGTDGKDEAASSDADLARRLDRLSRELDAGRRERAEAERQPRTDSRSYALAFRLASEFVAGVLVGAALGWGIDYLAGTSPWGLIGFLLLGFAAGVVNVVRAAGQMSASGPTGGGGSSA
ncbi:MAG TPA: AtpZ/AtpI family protein [Propylenella sp.]